MRDIVIVGAGVAGLSAAIYGLRAGKSVLLFEEKNYGGQIINTPEIENYPGIKKVSGFEFATNLYEQATELGAEVKYEKVLSIQEDIDKKIIETDSGKYEAKTVILATGAKNRPLGIDRERDFIGKGVSYCATCDGAFFRGKDVAVVGGGNTALEDAQFLASYCSKVYVIHRRDSFRGEKKHVEALQNKENVKFIMDSNVTELIGEDRISGIEVTNAKTEEKKQISLSGVFVAIGQMPDNEAFEELVATDDYGYISAGENCKTDTEGVYVAGDCRTKAVRQLTTAAADGAVAALAACEYLQTK